MTWQVRRLHAHPSFPWTDDPFKVLDRFATLLWLQTHMDLVEGKVLDYGCGAFKVPEHLRYRQFVLDRGGEHVPWDPFNAAEWCKEISPIIERGEKVFDAILCINMLCDAESPSVCLRQMERLLKVGGHVLCTYPTCWREIDANDKWRFTFAGMEALVLKESGFEIIEHVRRAEVCIESFSFSLGGAILLRKT